jgi:hypothetical protein
MSAVAHVPLSLKSVIVAVIAAAFAFSTNQSVVEDVASEVQVVGEADVRLCKTVTAPAFVIVTGNGVFEIVTDPPLDPPPPPKDPEHVIVPV